MSSKKVASSRQAPAVQSSILFRCHLNNTIFDVCYNRPGWTESPDEDSWDFNFAHVKWIHEFLGSSHMVRSLSESEIEGAERARERESARESARARERERERGEIEKRETDRQTERERVTETVCVSVCVSECV
jgi:hypothetical protein